MHTLIEATGNNRKNLKRGQFKIENLPTKKFWINDAWNRWVKWMMLYVNATVHKNHTLSFYFQAVECVRGMCVQDTVLHFILTAKFAYFTNNWRRKQNLYFCNKQFYFKLNFIFCHASAKVRTISMNESIEIAISSTQERYNMNDVFCRSLSSEQNFMLFVRNLFWCVLNGNRWICLLIRLSRNI